MSRIVIFEGVDESGRSELAKKYAELTGACYRRGGTYLGVSDRHLSKLYVEMMLPALLGYQDVVLDRSWIGERLYSFVGRVPDRVGIVGSRILERFALRCEVAVVWCAQQFDPRKDTYHQEYFRHLVRGSLTSLPLLTYTANGYEDVLWKELYALLEHQEAHPPTWQTGGNILAHVAIVCDRLEPLGNEDLTMQVPFGSFQFLGLSWWFAKKLSMHGVRETDLFWATAKDPAFEEIKEDWLKFKQHIYVLGDAASKVDDLDVRVESCSLTEESRTKKLHDLSKRIKETLHLGAVGGQEVVR